MNTDVKKMGRPVKYSTEDILLIMQQYMEYYDTATEVSASQIARFAQEHLGLSDFRHYTITRNTEAMERLKQFNSKVISRKGKNSETTFWRSIDVNAFLRMDKEKLKQALENLEVLGESITGKQTALIKENLSLTKKAMNSKEELENKKREVESLQSEVYELRRRNKELLTRIRTIEKKVAAAWGTDANAILSADISVDDICDVIQSGRVIDSPIFDITNLVSPIEATSTQDVVEEKMDFLKGLDDI